MRRSKDTIHHLKVTNILMSGYIQGQISLHCGLTLGKFLQPPPPTELKYADGCKCVKGKGTFNKETICTCPIIQTEEYDFDSYPSSYKPAAGKGV